MKQDARKKQPSQNLFVIFSALMLAILLAALDQTIVATALPVIVSDLNGLNEYSWVATSYLLTSAISTPLYGKISDMFGRKKIFLISISIFLIGSILCGMSQTIGQLVLFRGIQGVGAGGLFTLVLAIIGDVVPPRERGKYQGIFGGVFGVSSVVGPLLGGFITDNFSWRWVFYINIPIGLLAIFVIASFLHLPVKKSAHKIDLLGALLLAIAGSSLLLGTEWGGDKFAWGSTQIIGLFITFIISTILFIKQESRAKEPIIPLHLFKNSILTTSTVLSFVTGLVMFGAIIFLPEYQQLVRGDSATKSGLMMFPLVLGILTGSIVSGQIVSKIGKYRRFPIIGTLLVIVGYFLFTNTTATTDRAVLGLWMAILGLGIGQIMPILTLSVQNAVAKEDLGSATSTVTFFRSIGSSIGAAVFGAVISNRLAHYIAQSLPADVASQASSHLQQSASSIHELPPEISTILLDSFGKAFSDVFWVGLPFAVLAFIVALMLKDKPLKGYHHEHDLDVHV